MTDGEGPLQVMVVEVLALEGRLLDSLLDGSRPHELLRVGSVEEARARMSERSFDLVVTDDSRLRAILDGLFAFVAVFSLDGVVLDVNRAPLAASGLQVGDVVGRRFVDMPWWSHSPTERARVDDAMARVARGESVRFETNVRRMAGGTMYVDAAFAPLRDSSGVVVRVLGSGVDVTARRKAEEALAASEARLSEAQRVAHVGSWEWDVARNVVTWSDELYHVYGIDKAEFDGTYEAFLARVHAEDVASTKNVVQEALGSASAFVYDHRVVRADGAVRMLHTRGEVVADSNGRPLRLVGSCWDVTQHWQATRAMEGSISLLRSTLEATADGTLVVDRAGKIVVFNRRFLALCRPPGDLAEGAAASPVMAALRDQLEDGAAFSGTLAVIDAEPDADSLDVLRFKDGRVLERHSRPQRLGELVVGRVWSFRDITQRERLQRSADEARTAADRSRAAMEAVLERVSDGFVALDRAWRYTYVNSCAGRMLGCEPASLLGKQIWTDFPEGAREELRHACALALAEQRPIQIREHYAPWDRWFENRIFPSPDGLTIVFSDITAQVRAGDNLRASREQLRALAARLDAIREEERRSVSREIHDRVGQDLTATMLELARLRALLPGGGNPEPTRQLGQLEAVLEGTLETVRRVSAELRPVLLDDLGLPAAIAWQAREFERRTGVASAVTAPDDGLPAIDPPAALALFRILQEALTNVARHAGARRVSIELALEGRELVLHVQDDGRGITASELARQTTLGLLGMRERALVVGGSVSIGLRSEMGTIVTARVPIAPEPP